MRIRKIFSKLYQALLSGGCFENTAHTTVSLLSPPHLSFTLFFPLFSLIHRIITRARSLGRLMAFLVCLIKYWPLEGLLFLWVKVECATNHMCQSQADMHGCPHCLGEKDFGLPFDSCREQSSFLTIKTVIIYWSHIQIPAEICQDEGWRCLDMYSNTNIPFGFEYCSCETLH